MSFDEVWQQVTALRCLDAPATALSWKVMFARRSQPLLLPADGAQARAAVEFFLRSRARRHWARLLLWVDDHMPEAGLLPRARLDHFPAASLLGCDHGCATALYFGSPGPLQKLTILCRGADDDSTRVAKVALHASADAAVAREAVWLRQLGAAPETTAFVPQFVDEGILACGRRFVVMSGLLGGVTTLRFERRHREFLAVLAAKGGCERWTVVPAVARLRQRLRTMRSAFNSSQGSLLEAVLDEVEVALARQDLPACLVHGDFAPWNVRLAPERLFVFDWEYAQSQGNPLQDFLHFHLMPRVLNARRLLVKAGFMRGLLSDAASYARDVFGPDGGVAQATGVLAAHYLLDTIVFYVETSGYLDARHPVMRAYLQLLKTRDEWAQLARAPMAPAKVGYGRC